MSRAASYKTKQRDAILAYMTSLRGSHVTAGQIAEHFRSEKVSVGLATIYRHMDRLEAAGIVKKYMTDSSSGACYQYVNGCDGSPPHFHFKCESCGGLIHLQCAFLEQLRRHILEEHDAYVNMGKTVFYGKCESCAGNGK